MAKANRLPISVKELLSKYRYDPETGLLYKKFSKSELVSGSKKRDHYLYMKIKYQQQMVHRVCWMVHHRKQLDPRLQIDHINGDRSDNRLKNLRLVSQSENQQNGRIHRNGRPVGVRFHKLTGKWMAVRPKFYNGQMFDTQKYLGLFKTINEAKLALDRYDGTAE